MKSSSCYKKRTSKQWSAAYILMVFFTAQHRFVNMYNSLPEIVQPHHFQPTDGHHFVEIRPVESDDPQVASTVKYKDGILTDDEISEWLYQPVIPLFPDSGLPGLLR
jgi:hypothetical protein